VIAIPTDRRNILDLACFTTGGQATGTEEETTDMSISTTWRQRRQVARTRRALDRAIARSSSPAMRDELLTMANNSGF
jgi:hypothetical protein